VGLAVLVVWGKVVVGLTVVVGGLAVLVVWGKVVVGLAVLVVWGKVVVGLAVVVGGLAVLVVWGKVVGGLTVVVIGFVEVIIGFVEVVVGIPIYLHDYLFYAFSRQIASLHVRHKHGRYYMSQPTHGQCIWEQHWDLKYQLQNEIPVPSLYWRFYSYLPRPMDMTEPCDHDSFQNGENNNTDSHRGIFSSHKPEKENEIQRGLW